jgi:hypothetical protein
MVTGASARPIAHDNSAGEGAGATRAGATGAGAFARCAWLGADIMTAAKHSMPKTHLALNVICFVAVPVRLKPNVPNLRVL